MELKEIETQNDFEDWVKQHPTKGMQYMQLQIQQKYITNLERVIAEYGKDNSILSYKYKKEDGCFKPHTQWTLKDKNKFYSNISKANKLEKQLKEVKRITKLIQDFKIVVYEQMSLF